MNEIAPEELKTKLEAGESLQVVDIREEAEFAAWHITGAKSLPAYDALRAGNEAPLAEGAGNLSHEHPVVTVCRAGILSQRAASYLESRGFRATSLRGGMRGWGSVWSEAPIRALADVTFVQIRRNGKGCLSYLFGADGEAAVVDPSTDVAAYLEIAAREGLRITHVLETHVHADHLSRARELCAATGAELVMQDNRRASFPYRAIADGETITIGGVPVEAIATPGHTGESVCYLVGGEVLLTGDTLFVGAVGRPDLEKGDAGAEDGARALYRSLKQRLLGRFQDVAYFPAHHGSPIGFDGSPIGSTFAAAREGHSLLGADEQGFVDTILAGLKAKPGNFETIIAINEGKLDPAPLDLLTLEAGPNSCAAG